MNRSIHCFKLFVAQLALTVSLSTVAFASGQPTEGIVVYEWTGTVTTANQGAYYGVNVGDPASCKIFIPDDVDPYYVNGTVSRYHAVWTEIQAGQFSAVPDPESNYHGTVTMSNDIIAADGTYDKIETNTDFSSITSGYIFCGTRVFFPPSAFASSDLLLSTPNTPMTLAHFMQIDDSFHISIARIDFDTYTVTHLPEAADVNADTVVDVQDLLAVINMFGSPCKLCDEDVNEDGVVNVMDVIAVISAWDQ